MRSLFKRYSGTIIVLLAEAGLEMSPYQNLILSIVLWSVAGIWAIIATVGLFRNRKNSNSEGDTLSVPRISEKILLSETREALLQLHSIHSSMAEQIAGDLAFDQVKESYSTLISLYQSQGKMQYLITGEPDKDTRELLEQAFNSLNLKSANDKSGFMFISNMAWSMKDQSIILESAKDKGKYVEVSDRLMKLRAQLPIYDKQIGGCVKYSYRLNCWYALALWVQDYKDMLPADIRIAIAQNKDLMDDFIGELVSKVGK